MNDVSEKRATIFESDRLSRTGTTVEEEKNDQNPSETQWRPIIVTGLIFFLVGVENAMTGVSEWSYMRTIDPDATYDFFGTAQSISSWGVILFSIVFSIWTYYFQTIRWPLIIGRILAIFGTILYLFVEVFPKNRRYVMMSCYIIFAISSSSSTVLRAYFVQHSSPQDRARACALISLSTVISIVIGPLVQLAFSPLKYPGKEIAPGIYFNMFSGPIWISTFLNIPTILLIIFALPEMKKEENKLFPKINSEFLKNKWKLLSGLQVPWLLVGIVLLVRIIMGITLGAVGGVVSEMFIVVYGLSIETVVVWISIAMTIIGCLSIITAAVFILTPLSKWVRSRTILLIGFIASVLMYVVSYPYPGISNPVAAFNETTGTGCNPFQYHWCSRTLGVNIWLFTAIIIVAIGIALPFVLISEDTIYSKVVGEANQNLMQGFVVVIDCLVSVVTPLYVTNTFTNAGPTIFWIINGSITVAGALIWIGAFYWMKDY